MNTHSTVLNYYDELKSRRSGVAVFFTEWIEL
jgi:hypothetical protein